MLNNFDYEVCNCQKVTVKMIVDVIKNKKAKTLGEIQELTKAGTGCRHCIIAEADFGKMKKKIYCKDILTKVING